MHLRDSLTCCIIMLRVTVLEVIYYHANRYLLLDELDLFVLVRFTRARSIHCVPCELFFVKFSPFPVLRWRNYECIHVWRPSAQVVNSLCCVVLCDGCEKSLKGYLPCSWNNLKTCLEPVLIAFKGFPHVLYN